MHMDEEVLTSAGLTVCTEQNNEKHIFTKKLMYKLLYILTAMKWMIKKKS